MGLVTRRGCRDGLRVRRFPVAHRRCSAPATGRRAGKVPTVTEIIRRSRRGSFAPSQAPAGGHILISCDVALRARDQVPPGPRFRRRRRLSDRASRLQGKRTIMPTVNRTLATTAVVDIQRYREGGGGKALDAARDVDPAVLIDQIEKSGLRARGGAGVPVGPKWRTVRAYGTGEGG